MMEANRRNKAAATATATVAAMAIKKGALKAAAEKAAASNTTNATAANLDRPKSAATGAGGPSLNLALLVQFLDMPFH